jgi:hypothetical protein
VRTSGYATAENKVFSCAATVAAGVPAFTNKPCQSGSETLVDQSAAAIHAVGRTHAAKAQLFIMHVKQAFGAPPCSDRAVPLESGQFIILRWKFCSAPPESR